MFVGGLFGISSGILSGSGPVVQLQSGPRGSGPVVPSSQRRKEEEREKAELTALIKSRNPHLAGRWGIWRKIEKGRSALQKIGQGFAA